MRRLALLAIALVASCGGRTTPTPTSNVTTLPGPPLPQNPGCEGDELIRPTGQLRLLGQMKVGSASLPMVSANEDAIFVSGERSGGPSFFTIDRASGVGKPVPIHEQLGFGYVTGTRVYGMADDSFWMPLWTGPLTGELEITVPRTSDSNIKYRHSAVGPIVAFVEPIPSLLWHDRSVGWRDVQTKASGGLQGCLMEAVALRGSTLIVVEGFGRKPECTRFDEGLRVHFVRGTEDATASVVPDDNRRMFVDRFDATGDQAVVVSGSSSWIFHRDGTVEAAPRDIERPVIAGSYLFAPVLVDKQPYGAWEVREIHLPDHSVTSRGTGHGLLAGAFHDKHGAYWASQDLDTLYLWTLDFEFLGCPAD